jgi:peptidoglycan hydrolase-like protein with peptidoglycan-binding domain
MRKFLLNVVAAAVLCGGVNLLAQSDTVRQAQQALKDKGFDPGPIDGKYGPKTREAVTNYQKQNNIAANGRLGGETYSSLGVKNDTPGEHMEAAGSQLKKSYAKGGKEVGQGGKDLGHNLKRGEVTQAGKDFGKGVGQGAAKMGVGTGKAAKSAAKGVKDAFTPGDKKDK